MAKNIIYIIEDTPEDAEIVQHELQKFRVGDQHLVFSRGEDALEAIQKALTSENPEEDLPIMITLDLYLKQGAHGLEILKQFRAIEALRDVPILIFSVSNNAEDLVQSYKAGGTIYLQKPLRSESIQELID